MQSLNNVLGLPYDDGIDLNAPRSKIYDHEFLTIQHFFGIETYPKDNVSVRNYLLLKLAILFKNYIVYAFSGYPKSNPFN